MDRFTDGLYRHLYHVLFATAARRRSPMKLRLFLAYSFALFMAFPSAQLFAATEAMPGLDFKEWGLIAVQDGGRRKPMDTLASETLVRLTGQRQGNAFGQVWKPSDFMLSMLLDTHDWRKEPILLVDFRPL